MINYQNKKDNLLELQSKNLQFQQSKNQLSSFPIKDQILNNTSSFEVQPIGILNCKFYLIRKIGVGSSGSVFLSYSINDPKEQKTLYAIKIIEQNLSNENILNNSLEKINHKNILKIYEQGLGLIQTPSGLKHQVYYIIMDYLNHGSLFSYLGGSIGFGEDLGRLIFAQLLDGLEALHNSNIIHRDIKLENIMLSGNEFTLKYVDFGFVTEKSNGYLKTFLGTPNYAAPELHLKQPYLGVYEDIFSLGVTLFTIVTGHLPFILSVPNDTLYQYIFHADYINYWRKINIKVSPSFMELFDNIIAFDPSQRPSISEIRKSKWMQEINLDLFPELLKEFKKREEVINHNMVKILNLNNNENHGRNNLIDKVDETLQKIRDLKKIEVLNEIKNQLFADNNSQEKNLKNNKVQNNNKIILLNNDNIKNKIKANSLKGLIKIKSNIKKLTPLIPLIKHFFKKEGYYITKQDLNNFKIEISNGEIDVLLSFKKMYKEVKIIFNILNGNKEDYSNFKNMIRKFKINKK